MAEYRIQDRRVERDRRQAPNRERVSFEGTIIGSGEYLTDPIFFGRAYPQKPLMSYNSTWGAESLIFESPGGSTIWPHKDSLTYQYQAPINGQLPDGGFDFQGYIELVHPRTPVGPTIPTGPMENVTSWHQDGDRWYSVFWAQGLPNVSNTWEITAEDFSPLHGSHYSAKFIGDSWASPYLFPLNYRHMYWNYTSDVLQCAAIESRLGFPMHSTAFHMGWYRDSTATWDSRFRFWDYGHWNYEDFQIDVKSDSPCTVELVWHQYVYGTDYIDDPYNIVTQEEWDSNSATNWNFVIYEQVFDLAYPGGGEWVTLEQENIPVLYRDVSSTSEYVTTNIEASLMVRVKDLDSGQVVYLDDLAPNISLDVHVPASGMTVGVAEWIQDDSGMYVGAILWIKAGSPYVPPGRKHDVVSA